MRNLYLLNNLDSSQQVRNDSLVFSIYVALLTFFHYHITKFSNHQIVL